MRKKSETKIIETKEQRLNRLLVSRTLTGTPNPEIEKLQAELDLLNYGIVKKC
jgi:hypothetical protein